VGGPLVAEMRLGFELERRVLDVEVTGQAFLEVIENLAHRAASTHPSLTTTWALSTGRSDVRQPDMDIMD
jgi:hypothetical protein